MSSKIKNFAFNAFLVAVCSVLCGTFVLALLCVARWLWPTGSHDFLSTSFYIFASLSFYISAAGLAARFLREMKDFW